MNLQSHQLTCIDGSIGNVVDQRFCDPGSTPAGVVIFCMLNFFKSSYPENRGAHLNFVEIPA